MFLKFSDYLSLELFHPLSQSWFCSAWTAQENTFTSPHGGSAQCLEVCKSSLSFYFQFQQAINTCKSIITSTPHSVNILCPQICVCWMSKVTMSDPCQLSTPTLEDLLNGRLWDSTSFLFAALVFYSFLAGFEHTKTTFWPPIVLCPTCVSSSEKTSGTQSWDS